LKPNTWRLKVRVSICFVLFWGLFLVLFWCFFGLELLLRSTAFFLVWVEEHFGWKLRRKFFFFFFLASSGYERFEWNCEYLYSVGLEESEAQLWRVDSYRLNRSVLKSALF
jgi:hypothetical protein